MASSHTSNWAPDLVAISAPDPAPDSVRPDSSLSASLAKRAAVKAAARTPHGLLKVLGFAAARSRRSWSEKAFYLETFGCQMNVHDSEKVIGTLEQQGYRQVDSEVDADIILYNTCSIRDKAEQKVFHRLNDYKKLYASGKRFAVLGCVAQQEGERIFERAPYVSIVSGSASYRRLPEMLRRLEAGESRITGLDDRQTEETFETEFTRRSNPASRLHHHHRRMRQILRLLHRALHTRQRAQPHLEFGAGGGSPHDGSRLYGDSTSRAECQFLSGSGREILFRGIARRRRPASRASAASALPHRTLATLPATLWRPSTRAHALRPCAPSRAERFDASAGRDAARIYPRTVPGTHRLDQSRATARSA